MLVKLKQRLWTPSSWQRKPCQHLIEYPNQALCEQITTHLATLPALVSPSDVLSLKHQLTKATQGEAFLLQTGDCAEHFEDCNSKLVTEKARMFLQMGMLLQKNIKKPMIHVGRIAGQYAKPRSEATETKHQITLPSYRGDLINDAHFSFDSRQFNPRRMLAGYYYSGLTLHYLRSALNLPCIKKLTLPKSFRQKNVIQLTSPHTKIYTSHEALHLPYEQALTRHIHKRWFNLGTHFPWVGMRTAYTDSAHIEYLKGLSNPVAIKVGPDMSPKMLQHLIKQLNPFKEPGKLTLICRLGVQNVAQKLPALISAAQQTRIPVLWCCDPMHGNTIKTQEGLKTRRFTDIIEEIQLSSVLLKQHSTHLGGIHLELTSEAVTECLNPGAHTDSLSSAYKSMVDPRLNQEQALMLADTIFVDD